MQEDSLFKNINKEKTVRCNTEGKEKLTNIGVT